MEGKFKVEHVALSFIAEDKEHDLSITFIDLNHPRYIVAVGQIADILEKAGIENFEVIYSRWHENSGTIEFMFDTSIDAYEAYELIKKKVYFEEVTDGNENGTQTQESCELSQ